MKKILVLILILGFASCMPAVHVQQRIKERRPTSRFIIEVSPFYYQPLYLYPLILPRLNQPYQPYSRPFSKRRGR